MIVMNRFPGRVHIDLVVRGVREQRWRGPEMGESGDGARELGRTDRLGKMCLKPRRQRLVSFIVAGARSHGGCGSAGQAGVGRFTNASE